ncbi:MAG: hypothetical protein ACE5OY_03240 [Candidatus Bathyarchaeia archaeon]
MPRSTLDELSLISRSLGNPDSLKIFLTAKDGLKSTAVTPRKLGLTKKRYYDRLRRLRKAGLLKKRGSVYVHSPIGEMISETFFDRVAWALENKKRLDLIDVIRGSSLLEPKEMEKITELVLPPYPYKFGKSARLLDIVASYEDLVLATMRLIGSAKGEILLATDYAETKVAELCMKAVKRGVNITILDGGQKDVVARLKLAETLLFPSKVSFNLFRLFSSPRFQIRHMKLPYNMLVVDGRYAGIELPRSPTGSFTAGLVLESRELCERLKATFFSWYDKAEKHPLVKLSERLKPRRAAQR